MLVQGYVFGKKGIPERPDHNSMAKMLRQRIFEGQGITDSSLRQAIGKRSIGGASIDEPYNEMAIRIGKAAYKVTNEQITNVIKKAGSDKAAFELMVSAAVSAGLYRWDKANKILENMKNHSPYSN